VHWWLIRFQSGNDRFGAEHRITLLFTVSGKQVVAGSAGRIRIAGSRMFD
jgi:hypothetical protein